MHPKPAPAGYAVTITQESAGQLAKNSLRIVGETVQGGRQARSSGEHVPDPSKEACT